MAIVTADIDLAKSVFAVHGVDEAGKPALIRLNDVQRLDLRWGVLDEPKGIQDRQSPKARLTNVPCGRVGAELLLFALS